ncbi:MAG: DNA translocase FtsK 4TM domain-containing protein [Proteobacteria bacterium]|nr:DNA translocase FtsK 4TM domain-containing protein [Pseudomonadota bacterium]
MLFVLVALYVSLALIGYTPSDPSLNHAVGAVPQNMAGEFGAKIADPILQGLGYAALFPLLFFFCIGFRLLARRRVKLLLLRVTLLLLIIPLLTMSFRLLGAPDNAPISSYGGYMGTFVHQELLEGMPALWITVVAWVATCIAIVLCTGISLREARKIMGFANSAMLYFINRVLRILWLGIHWLSIVVFRRDLFARNTREVVEEEQEFDTATAPVKTSMVSASRTARQETRRFTQQTLKLEPDDFLLPATSMLREAGAQVKRHSVSEDALHQNSRLLQQVLQDFGIQGQITRIHPGPVVTLYELEPAAGTKSARVIGLADDIARSMSAVSARIAVIPGKNAMGIELPNTHRETVYLRELLESSVYSDQNIGLPLVLGKDISGTSVVADLSKMPHLLVAGTTGSGKSVAINTMILSLLYRYSPKQCQFIMIDPKMLELSVYQGIPHLLAPVVTEPKKAVAALNWVVKEMEDRYRAMSAMGVRNISNYNKLISDAKQRGERLEKQVQTGFDRATGQPTFETITMPEEAPPYIVVIVDEMADLMLVAGKEIESSIQRLAQMARAAGIHLIMATQRPSVDVITGVIKANFPTRISFQVTSKIDSRTILNEQGAEQLLGMGDMLYMSGGGRIIRVHGPFVGDNEVETVVNFLKSQGEPNYMVDITATTTDGATSGFESGSDDLYQQAVEIVLRDKRATTSYLQRCLKIGYNKAATLIEQMERDGIVSAPSHTGKREILIDSM